MFLSLTTKRDETETGGQQAGGQEKQGEEKEMRLDPVTFPEPEPQVSKDPQRSGVKSSASDGELGHERGRDMSTSLAIKGIGLGTASRLPCQGSIHCPGLGSGWNTESEGQVGAIGAAVFCEGR